MSQKDSTSPPGPIRMLSGGAWRDAAQHQEVRDPYRSTVVVHAPISIWQNASDALDAARKASKAIAVMPGHERAANFGGVKDSGMGREGPKYSIRDMTEERLLVLNFDHEKQETTC